MSHYVFADRSRPRSTTALIGLLVLLGLALSVAAFGRDTDPRSRTATTRNNAGISALPTSFIASIDTMKESRDTEDHPLTDAQIANDVNLSASLSPNYITVDTHYDHDAYMARWVHAIRATGKRVWFRSSFLGWGTGIGGIMTPAKYLDKLRRFIRNHPSLFRPGDIFDADAEPENGKYWSAKYGPHWSWQPSAPNAATAEFNAFLIALTHTADRAFRQLGISGVITTVHSTSPWWAEHPEALYPSTVEHMGNLVTIDAYPDADTTDPQAAAHAWTQLLRTIHKVRPHARILIGELGYSNNLPVNDRTQQRVLTATLKALSSTLCLVGLNYWVGAGTDSAGGYTHVFTGTAGAWSPRPAAFALSAFFAKEHHFRCPICKGDTHGISRAKCEGRR